MNRILFETQKDIYSLPTGDSRFEHVRGVLRMGVGDIFDVGAVNGPVGKATLIELTGDRMRVSVQWGMRPELPPDIHLLVGMSRPATMRKILTVAPTLGVRKLTFVRSARSDPAYLRSGLWRGGEWRKRLLEGVEQAFDTYLPTVCVEDDFGKGVFALPDSGKRLALDIHEAEMPLSEVKIPLDKPVCLAIGPERGWNQNDRSTLKQAGFSLVGLNERVLRVETAVIVGLTLLLQRLGRY